MSSTRRGTGRRTEPKRYRGPAAEGAVEVGVRGRGVDELADVGPLVDAVGLGYVTGAAHHGGDATLVADEPGVGGEGHPDGGGVLPGDRGNALPDQLCERVIGAHLAALAVILHLDRVVDGAQSGRLQVPAQDVDGLFEAGPGKQPEVEADPGLLGDDVEGAPAVKGADVGGRPAQQRVVGATEIGGVQGEGDLRPELDGGNAFPGPATVRRPPLDEDLPLQQAPLGDANGQGRRFGHQAGVAPYKPGLRTAPGCPGHRPALRPPRTGKRCRRPARTRPSSRAARAQIAAAMPPFMSALPRP